MTRPRARRAVEWGYVVATVERQGTAGRIAVGVYRAGLSLLSLGVGYPSRARIDALYRAACERTQSPAVRSEPAAAGIDVTAAAGHIRISRAGWAPRRLAGLTTAIAAGGPPWTLAALILAYSIGATR